MATLFEDSFLGSGLLASHVSDSGQSWTILSGAARQPTVGGGLVYPTSFSGGEAIYSARSQYVASTADIVTVEGVIQWDEGSGRYGFAGIGVHSAAGVFEFSISRGHDYGKGVDINYIDPMGTGELVIITNMVNGPNLLKAQLNFVTGVCALFVNNVQIFFGVKAQSFAAPFGAYLASWSGPTGSTSMITVSHGSLRITDEAPQAPVVGEWWTNIIKATETP